MCVVNDFFIVGIKVEDDPWAFVRPFEWQVWLGILLIAPFVWFSGGLLDILHKGDANWFNLTKFTYSVIALLTYSVDQLFGPPPRYLFSMLRF